MLWSGSIVDQCMSQGVIRWRAVVFNEWREECQGNQGRKRVEISVDKRDLYEYNWIILKENYIEIPKEKIRSTLRSMSLTWKSTGQLPSFNYLIITFSSSIILLLCIGDGLWIRRTGVIRFSTTSSVHCSPISIILLLPLWEWVSISTTSEYVDHQQWISLLLYVNPLKLEGIGTTRHTQEQQQQTMRRAICWR